MKLYVLAHLLAGLAGGWYLARTLGYRGAAALFLPIAFVLGARFTWILQGGQFTMLTFLFLPWLLAFHIRAMNDLRYALAGAAVFALVLIEGGTYGAPLSAFFLGCYACYRFFSRRFSWITFGSLAVILGIGVLLAAPKLIPMLGFWMDHPRMLPAADDSLGTADVWRMFFTRPFTDYMVDRAAHPHLKYGWWGEYGAWIGPVTGVLALGAFVLRPRRNLVWLLLALVSGSVMLGTHGPYSSWELLRHLPVLDSLRVPSRYSLLVTLACVIAASGAVQALGGWLTTRFREGPGRVLQWLPLFLCLVVATDLIVYSCQVLGTIVHPEVPAVSRDAAFSKEAAMNHPREAYVRMNRGTLSCRNELLVSSGRRLPTGQLARMKDEVVVVSGRGAEVEMVSWSPNRMVVDLSGSTPMEIRFRTNHDRNWESDVGTTVDHAGLLGVKLPPGDHRVTVRYSSRRVWDGLFVTALVLLIIVILAQYRRRGEAPIREGPRGPPSRRWALYILVGLAFLYLYPFPYFHGLNNPAENSRILMTRSLVDRGTFALDATMRKAYGSNGDLAVRDGKHYSCKAPGTSYLGVPVLAGARLTGVESQRAETWVLRVFLSVLPSIAFLFLFGRFIRPFVPDERGWILVMAGMAGGTMYLTYGLLLYGHQQAAISLGGAFLCFYANRLRPRDSALLLAAGGGLLALAVSCEYQSVFSSVIVGLYGLSILRRHSRCLWMFVGAVLPVALTMLYHHSAFGSALSTGHDFLENQAYRSYQQHGYKGMFVFSWTGLWGTLFSPRNGLFFYSPWLLFFLPGLAAMYRKPTLRLEALVIGLAVLFYVGFVSSMVAWKGGWSVGPRYLGAIIPLMILPVAVYLGTPAGSRPGVRILVAAAVMTSMVVYGLSSAVYPHLPEGIQNPFFEIVLPLVKTGHVPWSLGAFAGLRGLASALPYLLVLAVLLAAVLWSGSGRSTETPSVRSRLIAAVLILLLVVLGLRVLSGPSTSDPNRIESHLDLADHVWEPK